MISIIVIGKDEGWRLTKCLESIYKLTDASSLKIEVIYVDSQSSDDSIERALIYKNIKVLKVVGQCNAAVARNVGAKESKGNILFFTDGDMEIQQDFFNYIFNDKNELLSEYISGHLDDCFYDSKGVFIGKFPRTYVNMLPAAMQELTQNGGVFLITRKKWIEVGGMNTKFKINEDFDLSIRLRKENIKIIRISHLICLHHTVDYRNENRMWRMLFSGCEFYPALILREHLLDRKVLKRFLRSNYTAILLLATLFFLKSTTLALLYALVLIMRSVKHTFAMKGKANKIGYFFERAVYQFLSDILFWIGFIFFFPKEIVLEYEKIK